MTERPAVSPLREGADAAQELAAALRAAGFVFPSLRGDYPVADQAHVQLGGMSAQAVREFANWVRARS